jgi:hypothetical protein
MTDEITPGKDRRADEPCGICGAETLAYSRERSSPRCVECFAADRLYSILRKPFELTFGSDGDERAPGDPVRTPEETYRLLQGWARTLVRVRNGDEPLVSDPLSVKHPTVRGQLTAFMGDDAFRTPEEIRRVRNP